MSLHSFVLPLAVQGPLDALLEEAKLAGLHLGQDRDWEPPTIDDALFELVMVGSDRVRYTDPSGPHYPFWISVHLDPDDFMSFAGECGFLDPRGIEATLFQAMGFADSPSELHFEIGSTRRTTSAHDALAQRALLQSLLT